jgi:RNA polymerase sigma-70 factor, ECF subfamily
LVPAEVDLTGAENDSNSLDVAAIYANHAQFLWRCLLRMGVADSDLPDALQEVLLVVHRRLNSFDGQSKLSTWLFGICLRVAATVRRTRRRRREQSLDVQPQPDALVETNQPEQRAMVQDAQRRLESALDKLDPEKRAVFVMFELEGMTCADIAELLGVPKGTVFSRLSHARRAFLEQLARLERREQGSSHRTRTNTSESVSGTQAILSTAQPATPAGRITNRGKQ